jgi:hypothetical protein
MVTGLHKQFLIILSLVYWYFNWFHFSGAKHTCSWIYSGAAISGSTKQSIMRWGVRPPPKHTVHKLFSNNVACNCHRANKEQSMHYHLKTKKLLLTKKSALSETERTPFGTLNPHFFPVLHLMLHEYFTVSKLAHTIYFVPPSKSKTTLSDFRMEANTYYCGSLGR